MTSGPDMREFKELWASSLPIFDAQIDERWRNMADRVVVRKPILDKLECLLVAEFIDLKSDRAEGECDQGVAVLASFHDRGKALLDTELNLTAFETLYLAGKEHFLCRGQALLQGRNSDGLKDILQDVYNSLLPDKNGRWKFDPTKGTRFCTYAKAVLRMAVTGHLRRNARSHGYRLERHHFSILQGNGVPEEWLQGLEDLIGKFHPTGRFFESSVKHSLKFINLSFNDHRIRAIFDLARIPSRSRDDDRDNQNVSERVAPDTPFLMALRVDTSNCLRKMWKCGHKDEVTTTVLVHLRGHVKKEVAKHLNITPTEMTRLNTVSLELLGRCLQGYNPDD
jgi:hypothetical protein